MLYFLCGLCASASLREVLLLVPEFLHSFLEPFLPSHLAYSRAFYLGLKKKVVLFPLMTDHFKQFAKRYIL